MVETSEARKGAAVRLTFDVGGITGWRRGPGHPVWKRSPSLTDAATAFGAESGFPSGSRKEFFFSTLGRVVLSRVTSLGV